MASELDQQTSTDTGTAEAAQTPLDDILDSAADVPAREQESEAGIGGMDDPQVPLKALRKERERRQKADRQVEELRREMERFESAKYGLDEPQPGEENYQPPLSGDPAQDAVSNYDRSLQRFRMVHGKEAEAKVDAATKRMNAEQRQHVLNLAGSHADPVAAIHAYAGELGLLDFKGTPIDDVLASKDKPLQAQIDTSELAKHINQLNEYGQAISQAERRSTFAASKTDFVAEYGKAAYAEIDQRSTELAQSGHPVAQEFVQAVKASSDPVATAAQLLHQLGLWAAQNPQQAPQRQMTFPSDLANRRSVGQRHGPSYSGPTPLDSIFRH